jgi:hypothetical protein
VWRCRFPSDRRRRSIATPSLTLVAGRPMVLIMLRRILMTVMAVVALAGVAWGVTRATTTEVTTVGVKIRRAPR